MSETDSRFELGQIPTSWSVVRRAHGGGDGDVVRTARHTLLSRYGGAARCYLRRALCNWPNGMDLAEDAFQNFAFDLLTGKLQSATPQRGRFRDYLKRVLRNRAADVQRDEWARRARSHPLESYDPAADDAALDEADRREVEDWRDALVHLALSLLREEEEADGGGNPLHTVLMFHLDHPKLPSHEAAAALSARLGRPVKGGWVRKQIMLARRRLAELLVEVVRDSLADPTDDELREEMIEIGLYDRCRVALEPSRGA